MHAEVLNRRQVMATLDELPNKDQHHDIVVKSLEMAFDATKHTECLVSLTGSCRCVE